MARILIADDSKFMRKIINDVLLESEHTIVGEAQNGFEAIEKYKELKPDIITMDITMWGKNGLKSIKEILEIDKNAKVIVISALSKITLNNSYGKINANGFLTKPFEKRELINLIDKIL